MKKLPVVFAILGVLVFNSGCKKSSNTGTSSSSAGTTGVSSAPKYGFLRAIRCYDIFGSTLYFNANSAIAYFYSTPNNVSSQVQVGNVKIGSIQLKYEGTSKVYYDTTYMIAINPATWHVTGAGVIPSFTLTNNDSLPGYSGYMALPDTIDRSQNLSLQVNGVSNADMIEVLITDGTSTLPPHTQTQFLFPVSTNNTFTFSASSLNGMSMANGEISIYIQRYNDQSVSGKSFRLISERQVVKHIYLR